VDNLFKDILSDEERVHLERWIGLVAKNGKHKSSLDLYLDLSRQAQNLLGGPDDGFSAKIGEIYTVAVVASPQTLQYLCAVELWEGSYKEGPTVWRMRQKTNTHRFEDLTRIKIAEEVRQSEARIKKYKSITMAPGNVEAHLARRLKTDFAARFEMANKLGAHICGSPKRADKIKCPQCGRRTVYFYIEPGARNVAKCKHNSSCGWFGNLLILARSA